MTIEHRLVRVRSRFTTILFSFFLIGLGEVVGVGLLAGQGYEARDSAGIRIITAGTLEKGGGGIWTVAGEPTLQVGAIEGEDPYLFMRIWDGLRVPDGRLVVVEGAAYEVRVFGPDGSHDVTFGGRGDGPREFGGPPWISLSLPDTLVIWDPGHFRLSRYDLSGELIEQESLVQRLRAHSIQPFPEARIWQVAPDGLLLWAGSGGGGFPVPGLKKLTRHVVLFNSGQEPGRDLGVHPNGQILWNRRGDGGLIGMPDPFASFSALALGPEPYRVNIADGDGWEIRSFDGNGQLQRILRATVPFRSVIGEIHKKEKEGVPDLAAKLGMSLREAEAAFDGLPIPDRLPSIGRVFWDISGNLWVGRRAGSHLIDPVEYDVFDGTGRWQALVEMPASLGKIIEVGRDYVLAAWKDDLEVTYLRLYALNKPRP